MKGVKTALMVSILLALALIFSCSSPGGGGGSGTSSSSGNWVSCNIGGICVSSPSAELCVAGGGTVVATCPNDPTVSCNINGICTQVASSVCQAGGGTVVGSCGNSSSGTGGTGNSSSSAGGNDNAVLNCNMTATSAAFGFSISPTPVVQCNGMTVGSNLITWTNNPPQNLGNITVKVTATCGTTTKEQTCGPITVKAYCDYGYPTTDSENGCMTITEENPANGDDGICDYEFGKLVKSCNSTDRRDDIVYCDWGSVTIYGGGCYKDEENSATWCRANSGTPVTRCPNSSL